MRKTPDDTASLHHSPRRPAQIALAGLGVVVASSIVACGVPFGAGDYGTYRIASVGEPTLSGDCADDPNESTTFFGGATFLVYGVAGESADILYLDGGSGVMQGAEQEDGSYKFTGKTVEVDDIGMNTTITQTTDVTVTFTVDGTTIAGTSVEVQSTVCQGPACPNNTTCTASRSFNGVELEGEGVPPPN